VGRRLGKQMGRRLGSAMVTRSTCSKQNDMRPPQLAVSFMPADLLAEDFPRGNGGAGKDPVSSSIRMARGCQYYPPLALQSLRAAARTGRTVQCQ
jgi:hypothetical protein